MLASTMVPIVVQWLAHWPPAAVRSGSDLVRRRGVSGDQRACHGHPLANRHSRWRQRLDKRLHRPVVARAQRLSEPAWQSRFEVRGLEHITEALEERAVIALTLHYGAVGLLRALTGLVVGEGAAFLVLERASAASRPGATARARLAGWATGTDAGGRTGMTAEADGLVAVSRRALAVADMVPADIGYVNAHGTGTRLNDRTEARGLCRIFGDGRVPPVSSTKPVTGHCLGATPALEALIAISSLQTGCLPPTANLATQDPDCRSTSSPDCPDRSPRAASSRPPWASGALVGVLVFSAPDR